MSNVSRSPLRAIVLGAVAGVVASLVMAMYAMIAAWEAGTGFFTPLYHIASLVAAPDAMMSSMEAAGAGDDFRFVLGTGLLGAVIHMMTGAGYGALFGLAVSWLQPRTLVMAGLGLVYGAIVFAVSAFVALPVAAAVFDAGDPIRNMAEMAGWGTFFVEHLLFGLVLGLLVAMRPARSAAPTEVHAH